jgi:hypothetical protein
MTAQGREDLQHIPLQFAYLCADCHAIGNHARICPACSSGAVLSLATVLNRELQAIDATPIQQS